MRKCGWKKEEQGFGIDVIVSVRHPSRSSFLRVRPRAPKSPPLLASPRRAAPAENYPLTTGCLPFRLLFHLSSVSLPARSSTHRLQYYHLPLSLSLSLSGFATHPFFCPASLPLFRSERRDAAAAVRVL